MLKGKHIVLGVTGGIAAFKAIHLMSKLTQEGAIVKVILTAGAQKFVTPLSFQAIARQPVYLDTFDELDPGEIQHIALADWADLVVVAPTTANLIGKYAHGIADDLLSTTLLATTAPVYLAPAMNVHMLSHPAVKANLATLKRRNVTMIDPDEGYLACGYVGKGRMMEPEDIVTFLRMKQREKKMLTGKKVLVSAGPTKEIIDPVRFLSNHSTGKMGFALAEAAHQLGAEVTLVTGPVQLETVEGIKRIDVVSAEEMNKAMLDHFAGQDIVIKTAAVADYMPKKQYQHKLKKQPGDLQLEMVRTPDILKGLGEKKTTQYLVGFAAETREIERYGREKLERKQLDAIVINDISSMETGFGSDDNAVHFISKQGANVTLPQASKQRIAEQLFTEILKEVELNDR